MENALLFGDVTIVLLSISIWVLLSFAVGAIAKRLGKPPVVYGMVAFLINPLIGVVCLLIHQCITYIQDSSESSQKPLEGDKDEKDAKVLGD